MFVWESILNKCKTGIGKEKTLQCVVKMAFFQFWHPVVFAILTCIQNAISLFMASSNRSKFLEMCDGLLARVEPPLRSVLEQASKCMRVLYSAYRKAIHNTSFLLGVDRTWTDGFITANNFSLSSYKLFKTFTQAKIRNSCYLET